MILHGLFYNELYLLPLSIKQNPLWVWQCLEKRKIFFSCPKSNPRSSSLATILSHDCSKIVVTHTKLKLTQQIFVLIPNNKFHRNKFSSFGDETERLQTVTSTATRSVRYLRSTCRIWKQAAVEYLKVTYFYLKKLRRKWQDGLSQNNTISIRKERHSLVEEYNEEWAGKVFQNGGVRWMHIWVC